MDATTQTPATKTADDKHQRSVLKTIAKRSFMTLATTSPAQRSHSAGVVYAAVDNELWVHAIRTSRKARNIEANPHVGACVAFRRLPVGPPYTIHFQAQARLVAMDDPVALTLLKAGKLKAITGHGALDMPDGCFIRIRPVGKMHSFGPGARMIDLIRDPLNSGARSFSLGAPARSGEAPR